MDWRGCEIVLFGDAEFIQTHGKMRGQGCLATGMRVNRRQGIWAPGEAGVWGRGTQGGVRGGDRRWGNWRQGDRGTKDGRGGDRASQGGDTQSQPWQAVLLPGTCSLWLVGVQGGAEWSWGHLGLGSMGLGSSSVGGGVSPPWGWGSREGVSLPPKDI